VIIPEKADKLSSPSMAVMYDADADGKCVPTYKTAEFNEEIAIYYEQRAMELKRLHARLLAGEISPIGFFVEHQRMDIKDVAARARLGQSAVRKHMTPEGFGKVRVEVLARYARIFDVALADFFSFVFVADDLEVATERHQGRLIQQLKIFAGAPGADPGEER